MRGHLRRAQGRLGLPRPAGRDRGRAASSGIASKEEIEAYGIAEFNASAASRSSRSWRTGTRLTERIGFWVDLDDAYRTLDSDYIESVWWALQADLRTRTCCTRATRSSLLPALRHGAVSHEVALGYRDVVDPSVYVRFPVLEDARAAAGRRRAARLDDDAVDARLQRGGRGRPRADLRRARGRRRRRALVVAEALVERVLGEDARDPRRASRAPRSTGVRYEAPFAFLPGRAYGARGHTRAARRLRHRRRRLGPGPHRDRVRRGRLPPRRSEAGLTVVNPVQLDGTYDERIGPYAGPLRQGRRRRPRRGPARARPAAARRGLRARLPALLALRHAAALLRQAVLVHRDVEDPRRAAGGQRARSTGTPAHQARALRRLAARQRRLGAVARALLGHAAAGLALRATGHIHVIGSFDELEELSGRAARRPAPPVRRRRRLPVPAVRRAR